MSEIIKGYENVGSPARADLTNCSVMPRPGHKDWCQSQYIKNDLTLERWPCTCEPPATQCAHPECGETCQFRDKANAGHVHHPRHYNMGKIEVIDAIDAWGLGFDDGNAVKYIARARHKGKEIEDLEKAGWYLAHRIAQLKSQIQPPQEGQDS